MFTLAGIEIIFFMFGVALTTFMGLCMLCKKCNVCNN